ncbi:unnamed protein product [Chrysodeixis includens]|uniref:Uncharacterized protein n=1 Tax=Chrysodeixis includens TaxID=689277 RepID=A0A9N8KTB3_CHRIL|nr:unnamed protein product [Chrysodeixis includens]
MNYVRVVKLNHDDESSHSYRLAARRGARRRPTRRRIDALRLSLDLSRHAVYLFACCDGSAATPVIWADLGRTLVWRRNPWASRAPRPEARVVRPPNPAAAPAHPAPGHLPRVQSDGTARVQGPGALPTRAGQ